MKQAVHFGAGNIGRGFIGLLLTQSEYRVTFLDVNDTVISALKQRNEYTVELVGETTESIQVVNVTGINSRNEPELTQAALNQANLITTAVGPSILPMIAKTLVSTIEHRASNQVQSYLNIIACENTIGGSYQLETHLRTLLSDEAIKYLEQWVGFPNAAVDRIVPNQVNEDPLLVKVEPFYEWVIDAKGIKGSFNIEGVHFTDRLEAFIERKLFTVNTGHATVAYAAYRKGYHTIFESLKDEEVERLLTGVLSETSAYLVNQYGFDEEAQKKYMSKTIQRFKNPYVVDEVVRVARGVLRKLSGNDRFMKPLKECNRVGLPVDYLVTSIANALHYDASDDAEAVKLQELIKSRGLTETLVEITGLSANSELIALIAKQY
ncbi:MAG: mannitol-1-phosphate 5-dehydrogenase [Firmicutes bacterium HGW-Firmicutes-20]|jgi:mannitol-1-phosphate 5-dehydrogenase|nr:MAG: mannitol-1-phosphate 5-dehydrogenase [Firmicutes bacterium HGW-Firmicutes-20]PKM66909.1 MAG: mannitol-1-phosphate 5-dehydrogenase [Firmicutes bacterium HGW-Firmicutes-19]